MTFYVHTRYGTQTYKGIQRATIDREGNLRLFRRRGAWRQTADIFHPAYEWVSLEREAAEQAELRSPSENYRDHLAGLT